MCLPPLIRATIRVDDQAGFVAECADYAICMEGITREETMRQLRAALQACFERDENPLADYALIIEEA